MVDIKNRRHFLKKVRPAEDVKPELLFVGSTVTLFSRQLKLTDYGDDYTRKKIESKSERSVESAEGMHGNMLHVHGVPRMPSCVLFAYSLERHVYLGMQDASYGEARCIQAPREDRQRDPTERLHDQVRMVCLCVCSVCLDRGRHRLQVAHDVH